MRLRLSEGFWNNLRKEKGFCRDFKQGVVIAYTWEEFCKKYELIEFPSWIKDKIKQYGDKLYNITVSTGEILWALPNEDSLDMGTGEFIRVDDTRVNYEMNKIIKEYLSVKDIEGNSDLKKYKKVLPDKLIKKEKEMSLAQNEKQLVDAIYGELKRLDGKICPSNTYSPALIARLQDLWDFKKEQEKKDTQMNTPFIHRLANLMEEFNDKFSEHIAHETDYDYTNSDQDIENEYIDKLIELIPELAKAKFTWKDNWTNFDIREFLLSTEKELSDKYGD